MRMGYSADFTTSVKIVVKMAQKILTHVVKFVKINLTAYLQYICMYFAVASWIDGVAWFQMWIPGSRKFRWLTVCQESFFIFDYSK